MSEEKSLNFIEEIIEADLASGKHSSIATRFPPEPNGYLHIGHAKSICLNFGLANKYGGTTNLRFDDTNPSTEETEYVESIKADVKWLGFNWANELYASNYFDQLFEDMRLGKYADGEKVLRAKVDMSSPNMHMRDPIIYRIKHSHHHRTGNKWCIYPMYDFAHGQSDSIENITHSICTLEFIPHRELYNWLINKLEIFPTQQYEFARLNMTYTVMSKRKLLQLVNEHYVSGWDDPRMPTITGMRRRGYGAAAIREFCDKIGVAKRENLIDIGLLEFCVREELNKKALRRMVVFDPLKIIITNYDKDAELLSIENNPEDEVATFREVPFSNEIYIERDDFMEVPPKKFFRLFPGGVVRLKGAYIIKCEAVIKNEAGVITALECTYMPESKSGSDTSGINVKGTLHWVSAKHAITAQVKEYDRLFKYENLAEAEGDFKEHINTNSLTVIDKVYAEPALQTTNFEDRFQFLRKGYFCLDIDSTAENMVFNRTVTLKDTWAKEVKKN